MTDSDHAGEHNTGQVGSEGPAAEVDLQPSLASRTEASLD